MALQRKSRKEFIMSKKINTKAINATESKEDVAATKSNEIVNTNEAEAVMVNEAMVNTTEVKKSLQEYFAEYPNASLRKLAAVAGINYGIMLKKSKEPVPGQAYDPEAINWTAVEQKLASKKVDYTTLDWDALNEGPNRKGATLVKDMDAFQVGMHVWLRRDNVFAYEIVYKTATHVVLMKEGTSEPLAWSNNTFLINGPVFSPRAVRNEVEEA